MIYYANCKINLGLLVTGIRDDAYHNIESVLYPVPWHDLVEAVPSKKFAFSATGLKLDIDDEENICVKAYRLLHKEYDIPPVRLHLHKLIPFGAGLGGGSSDAVAVIKLINSLFELNIDKDKMKELAGQLGSDCPFFVENKAVFVSGRGEHLKEIDIDLTNNYLTIVYPQIHISTKEAYDNIQAFGREGELLKSISKDKSLWRKELVNTFEAHAFPRYPVLEKIKNALYRNGAYYASMTGSGSAIYGIFEKEPTVSEIEGFKTKIVKL